MLHQATAGEKVTFHLNGQAVVDKAPPENDLAPGKHLPHAGSSEPQNHGN